ncbi:MAG TPA: LamG-like jellyroll fold domain-containing protein, partial [Archangium sp.]|uniref:LamG-like jellyroll fold domain-containing protein n=1 Tax=Archangium sp. TaxID=1872627 RepID=UPI002EDA8343
WTGRLPFLPKNKPLSFVAIASNTSGAELFRGSTHQTLTEDNTPVSIVLVPATNGANITLPRAQRVTLPAAELFPSQSFPLGFLVEARAGERLDYVLEGAGGTFFPSQGSLTLEGTSTTLVIRYTAPEVASSTNFSHAIRLTNRDGHSVRTTFRLRVRPPSSEGVRDTSFVVRFNPVINALSAVRVPGTPQVAFEASVSDNRPLSELSYAWNLTPDGADELAPSFSPQANPTVLQGYTPELRGSLKLEVTDAEGGTTTLLYVLPPNQFPDNPTADTGFKSLLAGESHTCVLLGDGASRCWGLNDSGQLGQGHTHSLGDDEPLSSVGNVPLAESGAQLAVGGHHTCALLEGGAVRCWGRNDSGQLGYGHTRSLGDDEAFSNSGYVPFGGRAVELVAGFAHTCALLDTGKVRCWGHNAHGQLGLRHTRPIGDDELPSGDVDVGGTVRHLVAGAWHTCALLTTGAVRCWGRNDSGQLGLGHTRPIGDDESPASAGVVSLGGTVVQLAAHGNSQHTCALLEGGAVRCWGRNAHGQLGQGHTNPLGDDETPASVASVNTGGTVLQVATGAEHTCALLSPGDLKCWGRNESGQLGRGNTNSLSTPPGPPVNLGGSMAFQLAAGAWHTCALLSAGEPRCWGRNTHGQLGLGNTYNLGDNESPSGAALTTPLPPHVVETSQSAPTVTGGASLTLLVQAMDPQGSHLSFSWTSNTGTRSVATTSTDTSQVIWTAPACTTSGVTPTVTATVSNAFGLVTSTTFTPSVKACTDPSLVGRWTFENGSLADSSGHFGNLSLVRGAYISNGSLVVNAAQQSYARSSNYSGPAITTKTLVAWARVDDLSARGGTILTLEKSNGVDVFDGIVYAEQRPLEWMAGSEYFNRTESPQSDRLDEGPVGQLVQLAITYLSSGQINLYRNGFLYASYTKGSNFTYDPSVDSINVIFGLRHDEASTNSGFFTGRIEEAHLYNRVLSQGELQALQYCTGASCG